MKKSSEKPAKQEKVDPKEVEVKDLDSKDSPKGGQMMTQMLRMKHSMDMASSPTEAPPAEE